MGKSTAATMLRTMGLPVFDADASVHHLTGPGGKALRAVAKRFPTVVNTSGVDRQALGAIVYKDHDALKDLEDILHPMVRADRQQFFIQHAIRRTRIVVLDVPLLFEGGAEKTCDAVFVVSAPYFLQRQRALSRPGMTEEKFRSILQRQTPDVEKRNQATAVINSGLGKHLTWSQLCHAVKTVT